MKRAVVAFCALLACGRGLSNQRDAALSGAPGQGGAPGPRAGSAGGGGADAGSTSAGVDVGSGSRNGGAGDGGPGGAAGGDARPPGAGGGSDRAADARAPAGNPFVYVGGGGQLRIYQLDMAAGMLVPKQTLAEGGDNLSLASDPGRGMFYLLAGAPPALTTFAIDRGTGNLTKKSSVAIPGANSNTGVVLHPTGRWAFTVHYNSREAAVISLQPDGTVGTLTDRQPAGLYAHDVVVDPSGRYVFVPCVGAKWVAQFVFDPTAQKLRPNTPANVSGPSPRHLAFHPNGKYAYAINEGAGSMTTFAFDAANGTLSEIETVSTVPAGVNEIAGAHVAVHPSGRFVYGSNRTSHNIALFSVAETSGRLTLVANEAGDNAVREPRHFAVEQTGRFLVVANQAASSATLFAINPADGKLTVRQTLPSAPDAWFVHIVYTM